MYDMWVPPVSLTESMPLFWIMFYLIIKLIPEILLNDLNSRKIYILICMSDENILYIKVDQKNTTNTDTLPIPPPHPSNLLNVEHFSSGSSVCQMTGAE